MTGACGCVSREENADCRPCVVTRIKNTYLWFNLIFVCFKFVMQEKLSLVQRWRRQWRRLLIFHYVHTWKKRLVVSQKMNETSSRRRRRRMTSIMFKFTSTDIAREKETDRESERERGRRQTERKKEWTANCECMPQQVTDKKKHRTAECRARRHLYT